jgi:outer membrane lipoprotein-sorting protein
MQSEPETNGHSTPDEHSDLKRVFRLGTPSFRPVDIDAALQQATQSATPVMLADRHAEEPSTAVPSDSSSASRTRRRIIMATKVGTLGLCAASVCVALVLSLWGGNTVLAQVQDALKKAKTMTYTVTQSVGDQPAQIWEVKLLSDNLYRVDQPSGIYLIFDVKGKKIMEVNPGESKVRITENLPVPKDFNILAKLTNLKGLAAKVQPGVPSRKIGDTTATGFVIEESGAAYTVWVDPKTNLPMEMQAERKVSLPTGQDGASEQIVKELWSDFRFDQPLQESLFVFKVPEGFAVETRRLPDTNPTVEDERRRAVELEKAAREAAKKKAQMD